MAYLFTPWQHSLRVVRVVALVVVVGLAVPFAQPSAAFSATDKPRRTGSGTVQDALIVTLRPGVSDADSADLLKRANAKELAHIAESRVSIVQVPAEQREAARTTLLADPRVATVEDDAVVKATLLPRDPHWRQQWNARRVRAPEAWETSRGDAGVVIAIVDTGVDGTHPDLRGRMVPGYDFHNNDRNPYDDDGHGTAVATTAAAAGNDGVGVAGMCWRCRIMPVKVLNMNGHGSHSNIAAGIVWAVDHGADVINLSIAGLSSTTLMRHAVEYALKRGVVVVAAAGNSGSHRRTYPAAYPGVISVAATNEIDRLYSWSNRGSWVTMAAPGCAFSGRPRARWAWLCGTSLSTPIVAGAAGLMRSLAPRLSRTRLTSVLVNNTQSLRIGLEHGRLDAARAMKSLAAVVPDANTEPTPTPTATPKPTTKPTPTPTPKPSPTPSTAPNHDWRGTLGSGDTWDRETFYVRGRVHVVVRWSGLPELSIWVQNPAGDVIQHKIGTSLDFRMELTGGNYTFTVQEKVDNAVSYRVLIEYGL